MRVKSTALILRDDLDGQAFRPITLEQLRSSQRLFLTKARIAPMQDGGWSLDFNHRYLFTQRGQIRCFKTIEAACVVLHDLNVHDFKVALPCICHNQRKMIKWQPVTSLKGGLS